MKAKFIFTVSVITILSLIFLSSCKEKEKDDSNPPVNKCLEEKAPENLSPIDWENYNDVCTVYWNFRAEKVEMEQLFVPLGTIKITGWIMQPGANVREINPYSFYLTSRPNQIWFSEGVIVIIKTADEIVEQLKIKFENSDLTKKCYITGIVYADAGVYFIFPVIKITNPDNIYFE